MEIIRSGSTRTVLLTKKYAFKFPTFHSWESFLKGLTGNLQERKWKGVTDDYHLCPLLYSNRFGLLNIMPRCTPIKNRGLYIIELTRICIMSPAAEEFYRRDAKPNNFGILHGRMVKLDYGD